MHQRIKRFWIEHELAVVKGETQTPVRTLIVEVDLETWPESDDFDSGELEDAIASALEASPHVSNVRVIPTKKQTPPYKPGEAAAYDNFTGKRKA